MATAIRNHGRKIAPIILDEVLSNVRKESAKQKSIQITRPGHVNEVEPASILYCKVAAIHPRSTSGDVTFCDSYSQNRWQQQRMVDRGPSVHAEHKHIYKSIGM
jgi:hypothetical protein